jgi:hypothetical protein
MSGRLREQQRRELASRYNRGYTAPMKTAISLPDPLFKSAETLARRLGLSRSELYAKAIAEFIAQHDRAKITERLNAVHADTADEPPDFGLTALQARSLSNDQW